MSGVNKCRSNGGQNLVTIRRERLSIGNRRWIGEKSIKGKGLLSLDYLERSADIEGKGCEKRNARGKWRKCGRPVNTWTGFFTNRLWQFNQEEGEEGMVAQGGEDLSFRRERWDAVYPSAPSRMFSIHPAGILPVFFPFPASWTRVESREQIASKIDEWQSN